MSMAFAVPFRADTEFPREAKGDEAKEQQRLSSSLADREDLLRSHMLADVTSLPLDHGDSPIGHADVSNFAKPENACNPPRGSSATGVPVTTSLHLRPHSVGYCNSSIHTQAGRETPRETSTIQQERAGRLMSELENDKGEYSDVPGREKKLKTSADATKGPSLKLILKPAGQAGRGDVREDQLSEESGSHPRDVFSMVPGPEGKKPLAASGLLKVIPPRSTSMPLTSASQGAGLPREPNVQADQADKSAALQRGSLHASFNSETLPLIVARNADIAAAAMLEPGGSRKDVNLPDMGSKSAQFTLPRSQSVDNARGSDGTASGIDGILRTAGVKGRRTRPNRISNRSLRGSQPVLKAIAPAASTNEALQAEAEEGDEGKDEPCDNGRKMGESGSGGGDGETGTFESHNRLSLHVGEEGDTSHTNHTNDDGLDEAGTPRAVKAERDEDCSNEGSDDEDAALAARVKQGSRERREKAKRRRGEDDVMYWDWAPPAMRGAGPHAFGEEGVAQGSSEHCSGPAGKPKLKRAKGPQGSQELGLEGGKIGDGANAFVGEGSHENAKGHEGAEEKDLEAGGGAGAPEKPKGRGRGRPRKTPPMIEDPALLSKSASDGAEGVDATVPEPSLLPPQAPHVDTPGEEVPAQCIVTNTGGLDGSHGLDLAAQGPSPTPSPPPSAAPAKAPLPPLPPLSAAVSTVRVSGAQEGPGKDHGHGHGQGQGHGHVHGHGHGHGHAASRPVRRPSPSPPTPGLQTGASAGVPAAPLPPTLTMVTRQRDPAAAAPAKASEVSASSRVIRSRRVQEKIARAGGEREKPGMGKEPKPLYIQLTLTREDVAQDFAAITGHKRTPRPKRSNIAALGLALCTNLSQPHWNSY